MRLGHENGSQHPIAFKSDLSPEKNQTPQEYYQSCALSNFQAT